MVAKLLTEQPFSCLGDLALVGGECNEFDSRTLLFFKFDEFETE